VNFVPPWLEVARDEAKFGVLEQRGDAHNPRILGYHDCTHLDADTDEVPWCSSFVNFCIYHAGKINPLVPKETKSAAARSWLRYGMNMVIPALGCIVILQRGTGKQPGPDVLRAPGHVGFFIDQPTPREIVILGGNQSNQVCERTYEFKRVLGYRWPV
jgi:uncharacterized protein (TIGR02594 family)